MWFDLRGEGSKSCRIWVESCRFKVCFWLGRVARVLVEDTRHLTHWSWFLRDWTRSRLTKGLDWAPVVGSVR